MDIEIRNLQLRWEKTADPEDLKRYAVALIRSEQIEVFIKLLNSLSPVVKSGLLQFLGEPIWKKAVNDHFKISGILYGYLFVPSRTLEESEMLLQIMDLQNWREEFEDNKIEFDFQNLEEPERNHEALTLSYHFDGWYYVEIQLLSGSTNYWVSAILWGTRRITRQRSSGPATSEDRRIMELDTSSSLAGDYIFEVPQRPLTSGLSVDATVPRTLNLEILPL